MSDFPNEHMVTIVTPRLCIPVLTLGLIGCGVREAPVVGSVRFPDGSPLAQGRVVFESAALRIGTMGELNANGEYATLPVPPGTYSVYFVGVGERTASDFPATTPMVAPKFLKPDESGLTVEVGTGERCDITVEKPKNAARVEPLVEKP